MASPLPLDTVPLSPFFVEKIAGPELFVLGAEFNRQPKPTGILCKFRDLDAQFSTSPESIATKTFRSSFYLEDTWSFVLLLFHFGIGVERSFSLQWGIFFSSPRYV